MDALRPLSPPASTPAAPRPPAPAAVPAPADTFRSGSWDAPAALPASRGEPTERVRATLFRGGEALRTYQSEGHPVPLRDSRGRLSFVLTAPEGSRTRLRRVASDGEEQFALLLEGKVQVDPEGDRVYALHGGRIEALGLQDGHPVAAVPAGPADSLAPRPGGGVYAKSRDSLRILDAELKLLREVSGPVPGHVAELPGGGLALQDWQTGKLVLLDAQNRETCTLDRVSRARLGPDGAIWGVHQDEIVRVDPGTGTVRRLPTSRGYVEDLVPRADGSYVVHTRPDLTRFHLHVHSPDGVEVQTFHGKGKLEELQLDPSGERAYGMIDRWQQEPKATVLERYDLEKPRSGGLLGLLRGDEEGREIYRAASEAHGRRQHFLPMVLADGRVALAGSRDGVLLDRDGAVLQRFATAEEMRPRLGPVAAVPRDLGQPLEQDPDVFLRDRARIHCDEMPANFGRSQGAFPVTGGVQFARPGQLPETAVEVDAVDVSRLFESSALPERMTFPVGAGSIVLEPDANEGDRLVVEVPDREKPGAFVRKTYWLEEFEHYTRVFPVSTDRGQYVLAADDRGRAWWLDPAGGGDRRFDLPGAVGARTFSDSAVAMVGQDGATLLLELPGERILRDRRPGASPDDPDAPRIITTETEVRLGGVSLPIRAG